MMSSLFRYLGVLKGETRVLCEVLRDIRIVFVR
jgi:hypothetical protein